MLFRSLPLDAEHPSLARLSGLSRKASPFTASGLTCAAESDALASSSSHGSPAPNPVLELVQTRHRSLIEQLDQATSRKISPEHFDAVAAIFDSLDASVASLLALPAQ